MLDKYNSIYSQGNITNNTNRNNTHTHKDTIQINKLKKKMYICHMNTHTHIDHKHNSTHKEVTSRASTEVVDLSDDEPSSPILGVLLVGAAVGEARDEEDEGSTSGRK